MPFSRRCFIVSSGHHSRPPISWWFGWKCIQTNSGCFSQHSLGPQQPTNGLVRWEFTSFYRSKWPLPHFGGVLIGLPTHSRVWHTDQLPVDLTCGCFPLLRSGPKFHLVVLAWCDQAHNEKQAEKSKNQRCWFQIWVLLLEVPTLENETIQWSWNQLLALHLSPASKHNPCVILTQSCLLRNISTIEKSPTYQQYPAVV